jgi:2-methylcitrate dehydratase PrpD
MPNPPGHPDNPMTDGQMDAKFRMLAGRMLPAERVEAALAWLRALPAQPSVRPLPAMLRIG